MRDMKQSKRIPEIDIAKAFGISIVILQHAGFPMNNVFTFLTVFALPLFFILSGVFMRSGSDYAGVLHPPAVDPLSVFKNSARRLLLPYLFFSVIDLSVILILELVKNGCIDVFSLRNNLLRFFTMYGISVLWFLSALWMSRFVFSLLLIPRKKYHILLMILLIFILILTVPLRDLLFSYYEKQHSLYQDGTIPFSTELLYDLSVTILRIPVCVFFMALGNTAYRFYDRHFASVNSESGISSIRVSWERLPASAKGLILLLVAAACFSATYFAAVFNFGGNIPLIYYGKNLALYLSAASLGSLGTIILSRAIVYLCKASSDHKFLRALTFIGENSLIIMLTHMDLHLITIAMFPLRPLLFHLSATLFTEVLFWTLVVCLTLIVEIPVILVIRRFFPFLLGSPFSKNTAAERNTAK